METEESKTDNVDLVDVLQEWENEEDASHNIHKRENLSAYSSSLQYTLDEITRDTFSNRGKTDVDDLLKELLLTDSNNRASSEVDDIFDEILSQILSKDLLYEPLCELLQKYPSWLDGHIHNESCKDPQNSRCRYESQVSCLKEIIQIWDQSSGQEECTKDHPEYKIYEEKMMKLLVSLQEYGNPPVELIQAIGGDPSIFNMAEKHPSNSITPECSIM